MKRIQQITDDANQTTRIVLDDGSFVELDIKFFSIALGWFITRLQYNGFTLNGLRICNSPNMLRQYRDQIPFGLACTSEDMREPFFQDDFSSEFARLFILNEQEVQAYEDFLSAEV